MTTQSSETLTPSSTEVVSNCLFPLTRAEEQVISFAKGPPYEISDIHKLTLFNETLAASHRYLAIHVSSGFTRITATEYYAAADKCAARANLFILYQNSFEEDAPINNTPINDHRPPA